jgi:hypothetical protein
MDVDRVMEDFCRRLALLAEGRARQAGRSETARLRPGSAAPMRVEDLAGEYARAYETLRRRGAGPKELLAVVKQAQDAWLQLAYGPAPERVRGTLDWKIAIATDERPSHVVGRAYGISASHVRNLRKAKRDGKLSKASRSRSTR